MDRSHPEIRGEEDESTPNVRYDLSHFRPNNRGTLNEIMDAQERLTGSRTRRFGLNGMIRVLKRTPAHSGTEAQSESTTSDPGSTRTNQPGRSREDSQKSTQKKNQDS